MDAIRIEPQQAASSFWGDELLNQCIVSEERAVSALERAQFLGQMELGSCTLTFVADPARQGRKLMVIQTSSGDFAMIPSELFAPAL